MAEKSARFNMDEMEMDGGGGCIRCGALVDSGIEPDARGYECDECGARAVYGAEELVMMGLVD